MPPHCALVQPEDRCTTPATLYGNAHRARRRRPGWRSCPPITTSRTMRLSCTTSRTAARPRQCWPAVGRAGPRRPPPPRVTRERPRRRRDLPRTPSHRPARQSLAGRDGEDRIAGKWPYDDLGERPPDHDRHASRAGDAVRSRHPAPLRPVGAAGVAAAHTAAAGVAVAARTVAAGEAADGGGGQLSTAAARFTITAAAGSLWAGRGGVGRTGITPIHDDALTRTMAIRTTRTVSTRIHRPTRTMPPMYIEQSPAPAQGYWYYDCQSPAGYYPWVEQCAQWLLVSPEPPR